MTDFTVPNNPSEDADTAKSRSLTPTFAHQPFIRWKRARTWNANSRVWQRTRAWHSPDLGSSCCSTASTNTAVLPMPDLAWQRTSSPRIAWGMHSCWTVWGDVRGRCQVQFVIV